MPGLVKVVAKKQPEKADLSAILKGEQVDQEDLVDESPNETTEAKQKNASVSFDENETKLFALKSGFFIIKNLF